MVTGGGGKLFDVRHGKNSWQSFSLPWAKRKTHIELFFPGRYFSACALEKPHGNAALCHASKKCARQRFERTAKSRFPVTLSQPGTNL
jgi:hypothetical protein